MHADSHPRLDHVSRAGHPLGDGRGGRYERRSKYTVMATELAREIEEGQYTTRANTVRSPADGPSRFPTGTSRREAEAAHLLPFSARLAPPRPQPNMPPTHQPHPYQRPSSSHVPYSHPPPHPDQASYLPHLDHHFAPLSQPTPISLTPSTLDALQQYGINPPQQQQQQQQNGGNMTSFPTQPDLATEGLVDLAALGFAPFDADSSVTGGEDQPGGDEPMSDSNWNEMLDSWAAGAGSTTDAWTGWEDVNAVAPPPQADQEMTNQPPRREIYPTQPQEDRSANNAFASGSGSSGRSESSGTPSTVPSISPLSSALHSSASAKPPATINQKGSTGAVQNYSSSLRSFAAAVLSSLPTPSILVQSILPASNHSASKSSRSLSPPPPSAGVSPHPPPPPPPPPAPDKLMNTARPTATMGPSILERRQSRKAEGLLKLVGDSQDHAHEPEVKQEDVEHGGFDLGLEMGRIARRRSGLAA